MSRHARLIFLQSALRPDTGVSPRSPPLSSVSTQARHWCLATLASSFFSQHSGPDTGVSPRSPRLSSVSTQAPTLVSSHALFTCLPYLQSALRPRHWCLATLSSCSFSQHSSPATCVSPRSLHLPPLPSVCIQATPQTTVQALVYHIFPPTTAITGYAISLTKQSANGHFFVGAEMAASL